jgi:hypothetical protein
MLGEATFDVSGTFAGEAIRVLILFVAQHCGARDESGVPERSPALRQSVPKAPSCDRCGGLVETAAKPGARELPDLEIQVGLGEPGRE